MVNFHLFPPKPLFPRSPHLKGISYGIHTRTLKLTYTEPTLTFIGTYIIDAPLPITQMHTKCKPIKELNAPYPLYFHVLRPDVGIQLLAHLIRNAQPFTRFGPFLILKADPIASRFSSNLIGHRISIFHIIDILALTKVILNSLLSCLTRQQ